MDKHSEFKLALNAAQKAYWEAMNLLKDGKKVDAKKKEKEGDAHYKRAKEIFKHMKEGR